ncbi:MAG TPA: hypothetical protein VHZ51_06605 [Ktedonobacteraceae bacterium]|nr:hypothetical protein [Ktedonobacteraceae bacterium]
MRAEASVLQRVHFGSFHHLQLQDGTCQVGLIQAREALLFHAHSVASKLL